MGKESFYFPHDYDATADPKMQALIGKYGGLGYGIFWRTIEMLHSNTDHKLPLKPYIFSAIAKQMLTSDEQMLEIISYCIDFCELFTSNGECFWSNRVNQNFEKRAEISEKRSFAGKLGVAAKANAKQNLANTSKGKEKKGKEIKEKNTTPPEGVFVLPDYIPKETWQAYLELRNKKRAAKTNYALNLIIKELEKYKPHQLENLNQSIKNGWTDIYPLKENGNGNRQTNTFKRNYGADRELSPEVSAEADEINRKYYAAKQAATDGKPKENAGRDS